MNESSELHKGDEVSWHTHGKTTHGTTTHGTVQDTLTSATRAAGRTVRADPDHPQYLVRGDKSGRHAVHTPQALHKVSPHEESPRVRIRDRRNRHRRNRGERAGAA